MTCIYLHGFNSDGEGWKADALRRQFPDADVWAPDLPAEPQAVVVELQQFIQTCSGDAWVFGTSLGGFYAWWASAHFGCRAFLFNPSLSPHQTLAGRGIGHFKTWTKGRDYHFKEEYLPQLEALKAAAHPLIQAHLLYFFLATDDDVLDHSAIAERYPASALQWYEGAGHGFSKFEKVLKQIKKAHWPQG